MLRCLPIAILFLLGPPTFSQPQYRFQHFDTKDGLASDLSEFILQDSLGFLWIAHIWSVSRYDGYKFKTYRYNPEDTIRSLGNEILGRAYLDRSGNFWIGSTNVRDGFQLNKYDRTIDGFRKYRIFTNGNIVWRVSFEKDNRTLWGATDNGIYSFNTETNETKNFMNPIQDSVTRRLANSINDISVMDSCLLLVTRNGLWKFDKSKETFSRPLCNAQDSAWLYHTEFYDIYDERSSDFNNVWLLDMVSLTKVNKDLAVIQRLPLPDGLTKTYLRNFDTDKNGVFWFGTWFKGVFRYDPSDSSFLFNKSIPGDPNSLRADRINDVKVDRDQNIWVSTYRGISKLPRSTINFYNVGIANAKIDQSSVFEAGGSEYVIIDFNQSFHKLMIAPLIRGQLDSLNFKILSTGFTGEQVNGFWKGRHNFWIAAWNTGILGLPIDTKSGMIRYGPLTTLSHSATNPNTISSNATVSVWEDADENLWVGIAGGGLNKIVHGIHYGSEGSVIRYKHNDADSTTIANDNAPYLYPEDEKSFWIGTTISIDLYRNDRFEHYFYKKHLPSSVLKSRDGILFVGTGTGLFEGIKSGIGYTFSKSPYVKNSDILNMKEDQMGRLWIVTGQGMTFYDQKEKIALEFNEKDGFNHNRVYNSSLNTALSSSGIMVMSDFDGLTLFEPLTLRINRSKTYPLLTSISVNNKTPLAGHTQGQDAEFRIKAGISVLDELVLDYQHNNFTLEFSSMELTSPEKNLYKHMLEGYDKEWIESDWKNRTATYTNLDAGTYIFKVKASNYHGIWNDNEKTLRVTILPPPWRTWWAYSLYGLACLGVFLHWRSFENKRIQLKHRATYLSELDNLKTRFFANISHEFRTPITLILGPLKEMYNGTSKDDPKKVLGLVIRKGKMFSEAVIDAEDVTITQNEKVQISSEQHPVLLIVEDNADMRNYIRKTLYEHYHIIEAGNGKEGVEKAEEIVPDLIISDVMMPEMDGYKLCELIKTSELTSHIPVILLTAKADRQSKLTGLETGADDYLSKPFDADELKLIVRNRIEERRKMRERFSREITLEPKKISITSLDEKFLTKVLAFIEERMHDEDFSIEELSLGIGYSSMHLYRKLKALAGQTPSQFVRTIRLKRAADMLSKKSDNISQIAYNVGFSNVSYFNKCFKDQFGMTPGEFVESPEVRK